MTERGQTPSDYLIGISLVLVTIIGVFGVIQGGIYEPFEDPVGGEERTMADEFGATLIDEYETAWGSRTVDNDTMTDDLDDATTFQELKNTAGVPEWKQANVTLRNESSAVFTAGDAWHDEPAATSTRVVRSETGRCAPHCRLVVRVWS